MLPRKPTRGVVGPPPFVVERHSSDELVGPWDVLFCSIGFEERSRYVLEHLSKYAERKAVSAYDSRRGLSFESNLELALAIDCDLTLESDGEYVAGFHSRLSAYDRSGVLQTGRVALDISSASRTRLAASLLALLSHDAIRDVDILYCPAAFHPPHDDPVALATAGPVSRGFVGRSDSAQLPLCAVMGLGYESLEALGAFQYMEAGEVWSFIPWDVGGEYHDLVMRENAILLKLVSEDHRVTYAVNDPVDLYDALDQVVYGASDSYRPVLVPMGPKIFAAAAMLVSMRYGRVVPVWRFSSEQYGLAYDVQASGSLVSCRVRRTEAR